MNRATIATLALGAAMLFPNWAAAHVLSIDDISPLHQVDDARVREVLPQTHECIQVPVTFRTQSMTQAQMEEGCGILKEVDDRFHAKLRTSPDNPVEGDQNDRVEAIVFNSRENFLKYSLELFGFNARSSGFYAEGDSYDPHNTARIFVYKTDDNSEIRLSFGLEHEYVHYLDGRFIHLGNNWEIIWAEGLAVYIALGDVVNNVAISLIGDGSDLLSLYDIFEVDHNTGIDQLYKWSYLAVRFLFEKHFDVVLDIKEIFRSGRYDDFTTYFDAFIQLLTDDFHRWLREFVPVTIPRQIEPVTIFEDGTHGGGWPAIINLANYFRTSQSEVTYTVSLSVPYDVDESNVWDWLFSEIVIVAVDYDHGRLYLQHGTGALGTVEVTVTATAPNGDSAEQTFIVNVVEALQSKAITLRDAVSTEEGTTAINLASYFSGPALSEVEFTAESNDADVARVAVRDGRVIITAVAVGEAEVTVRTDYYGRQTTQTFTVTITDDCPSYLCRGFFHGWRWLLLEDGQALPATETD